MAIGHIPRDSRYNGGMILDIRSHYVPINIHEQLHVREFHPSDKQAYTPVLMIHGAISNSRIFGSPSGRGLGPWLAQEGLRTFAADLRGRGQSTPPIGPHSLHGQYEDIHDIARLIQFVQAECPGVPIHLLGHSWGGELLASALARFPELRAHIASITMLAVKRSIAVFNREKLAKIDLFWMRLAPRIAAVTGYLPARALRAGSDNETCAYLQQSSQWIRPGAWVDPVDGFDYQAASQAAKMPPILSLVGSADQCLGHPQDVARFMAEISPDPIHPVILSRANGYQRDYHHTDILTHPDAPADHFPHILRWIQQNSAKL
jgi:pimeloyl-ACP methyl ester carboxylesterase